MAKVRAVYSGGEVITSHDASVARVVIGLGRVNEEYIGSAKRHPHDNSDAEIGELLALGRALERAGRKLQKRANGLVKHKDDVKQLKEQAKKEKRSNKKPVV